jgi:putative lipase involved disintegration of autophagic bodies
VPVTNPACVVVQVVRSIHVTGHSLGGALASLCAYDLSTTVAAALQAADDPLTSNKCTQLKNDLAVSQLQLVLAICHSANLCYVPLAATGGSCCTLQLNSSSEHLLQP